MATNRTSPKKGKVVDIPTAPTIGTATAGAESATVAFTAATIGGPVTTYTALSSPGSVTGTGSSSPITVSGLTAGTSYTFTVRGNNATGNGEYSVASNSIVPTVSTAYESIATVSLSGTQATISFSSIPSTYKHLQLRYAGLSASMGSLFVRMNGDTNDANYVTHYLTGNGSSVSAGALASSTGRSALVLGGIGGGQFSTTYPYVGVIDFLDYTSTNKYRTVRSLHGTDTNNTGYNGAVGLSSGLYLSTTALSSLTIFLDGGNDFTANTKFALYGIKG